MIMPAARWLTVVWEQPGWLLALPLALLPLLRKVAALPLATAPALRPAPRRLLRLPALLYACGVGALVIALAGPRLPAGARTPPPRGHLILVFDTSASMGAPEGGGTRLDAARAAARGALAELPPLRAGVVRVAGEASVALPLTQDPELLAAALADLRVEPGERGTSALGDGVAAALRQLPEHSLPGAVLLVSDGRNNAGRLDLATVGAAATALRIPVYALGAGAPDGEDPLDEAGLRELAAQTGGVYGPVAAPAPVCAALRAQFPGAAVAGAPAAVRMESMGGRMLSVAGLFILFALLLAWGPLKVYP